MFSAAFYGSKMTNKEGNVELRAIRDFGMFDFKKIPKRFQYEDFPLVQILKNFELVSIFVSLSGPKG